MGHEKKKIKVISLLLVFTPEGTIGVPIFEGLS